MNYRTLHVVRHVMPEDRLAAVRFDEEEGVIVYSYKAPLISTKLVAHLRDLSNAICETGLFDVDPTRLGAGEPRTITWMERLPSEYVTSGLLDARYGVTDRIPFWELRIRDDMIDPAILRELNEILFPEMAPVFTFRTPASTPA